jgi:hypothetical protein
MRYNALRNMDNYNIDEMTTLAEDLSVISYQLVVGVYATLSVINNGDTEIQETAVDDLMFHLCWIHCFGELVMYDLEESLYYAIDERSHPTERFTPMRNNRISSYFVKERKIVIPLDGRKFGRALLMANRTAYGRASGEADFSLRRSRLFPNRTSVISAKFGKLTDQLSKSRSSIFDRSSTEL